MSQHQPTHREGQPAPLTTRPDEAALPSGALPAGRFRGVLLTITALALGLRLFGIGWDGWHYFHPDERRVAEAVATISFSPLQLDPRFYAYGSFPMYVTRLAVAGAKLFYPGISEYDLAVRVGRGLAALWGAATVFLLGLLGRRLFGEGVGLLAAALLALTVTHLQNSHFLTNDVPLTFLVLAALALLLRAVDGVSTRHWGAAGAVVGLALATKISAAPLGLPLGLGLAVFAVRRGSLRAALAAGAAASGAAMAAFLLAQPYAVLSHTRFVADVLEQSRMVRQAGLYPYTHQYVGAPLLLYEVRELVLWGMGPLPGVVALVGLLTRLRRRTPAAEWLLLAWVVPFLLINASFEIKYPRYLLPIVPLLCLWGAAVLTHWAERGRGGRWLRFAVLALTALYAAAFASIYAREHPVRQASAWLYEHVPAGSRVLTPEWDEGFPFHLPDRSPERYRGVQFPFYEPDSEAKARRLAAELAAADVVAFPTRRIPGSVTRAEATFPVSARFFRLLWAGDLGFRLEQVFTARPGLLGLELPSELADESFSVYDHPKVVIFRKVRPLSAAEVEAAILAALPSLPLSRDDLLLADGPPGEAAPLIPRWLLTSSWAATVGWVVLLQLLGWLAWRVLARAGWPGPGLWALAKVLGALGFAAIAWLAVSLGWMRFVRADLVTLLAVLAGAVLAATRRPPPVSGRERWVTEAVVWGAFALFLFFRAAHPEVFWGEKPMDFAILNALDRTASLPPTEPWFAGSSLHYSYFGQFMVAAWGKTLGAAPAYSFNLGVAAVAGLLAAAAFAAAVSLTGRLRSGVYAAALALLAGNLAGPVEAISRKVINFDYFWATSRVFPPAINEYPFWSLLFADLHAHLLAAPLVVTLAALTLRLALPDNGRRSPAATLTLLLATAVTAGAITVTNGWSLPTVTALVAGSAALGWWHRSRRTASAALGRVVLLPALLLGGAWLVFRPFWASFVSPPRHWGWEAGPYAPLTGYLLVLGVFVVLLVPGLAHRPSPRPETPGWVWNPLTGRILLILGGLAVAMEFLLRLLGRPASLPAALPLAVGAALAAGLLALRRDTPQGVRGAAFLASLAFAMTAACEVVFVWDRMNTVFKYHFEALLLLAVAGGVTLTEVLPAVGGRIGVTWRAALAVVLAASAFTSVTGAWGRLLYRHTPGPRWTLDGQAFLRLTSPHEARAFDFLNRFVPGTPTLVEAHGPAYQQYARAAMHTGLPIVVGWEYHLIQRSQRHGDILTRARAVEAVYTSPEPRQVAAALARYKAAFVLVGRAERERYGPQAGAAFTRWPELLRPVFSQGDVTLYAVRGQGALPLEMTVRTPVAPSPVPTPPVVATAVPLERLGQPRGLAVGQDGAVYVCDFEHHRILKLNQQLRPLLGWGREGDGPGEFNQPCGVAVGPTGEVYVADTWNHRVQVFSAEGELRRAWSGEFFGPRGIAVNARGQVFVADTGNSRVVRFDPEGRRETSWGGRGRGPGQFSNPVGIAVDQAGRVWVADNGNARLQVFDENGAFLVQVAVPGLREEAFSEPYLAVLPGGTVAASVPLAGEIRIFRPDGTLAATLSLSSGERQVRPTGLAALPDGRTLAVADVGGRVFTVPF